MKINKFNCAAIIFILTMYFLPLTEKLPLSLAKFAHILEVIPRLGSLPSPFSSLPGIQTPSEPCGFSLLFFLKFVLFCHFLPGSLGSELGVSPQGWADMEVSVLGEEGGL